jgi:hypothetical protein
MQVIKRTTKQFGFLNPIVNSYKICRFKTESKILEERKSLHLMKLPSITTKDLNKIKLKACKSEMNTKMKELDVNWDEEEIAKVKYLCLFQFPIKNII